MNSEIFDRLQRIEMQLEALLNAKQTQEWYDTKTVAEILTRSAYSVREWCRLGRVQAQKRQSGRGSAKEWMISHTELLRIKSVGLLPLDSGQR